MDPFLVHLSFVNSRYNPLVDVTELRSITEQRKFNCSFEKGTRGGGEEERKRWIGDMSVVDMSRENLADHLQVSPSVNSQV